MADVMLERMTHHYQGRFRKELQLNSGTLDHIKDFLEGDLDNLFLEDAQKTMHVKAITQAHAQIQARFRDIEYMRDNSVRDLHHQNWYAGPDEEAPIWNQLVNRLQKSGRSDAEIRDLDRQSTAILSLTHKPVPKPFRSQGIVVGHVQSGKTGNMSAVMAKAADTPYRFFLVLSGLTDALREQTQVRFDADLGTHDTSFWHRWTTEEEDFLASRSVPFQFDLRLRQLAVVKKNKDVLKRILDKLKATPEPVLKTMPFMVIDDECDQASVNSAKVAEEMSKINDLVRQILEVLPRVTYVGYTATPYANVLVNPKTADGEITDLYPKDFIYAMTPPDVYFGAERLFGRQALTGELEDPEVDSYDGLDMIRAIPEDEAKILRPRQKDIASLTAYTITPRLDRALKYYLLAIAARAARGQADRHSSMLINTSHLVKIHFLIARAIDGWLTHFSNRLTSGDPALYDELEDLWARESSRVDPAQFGLDPVPFAELHENLFSQLEEVEIIVENGPSDRRMDFSSKAQKYVVIGGNVVSRGLTIEGLIVSFFLRTASQYDTLMQMGRWFGYRQGYEDIPRIWMEEPVRNAFRSLAMVEAEIRSEIAVYHERQLNPLQFALRIRRLPGMLVTAKNKMHHASVAQVSYAGRHMQTFRFNRNDTDWLSTNWNAGNTLLHSAHNNTGVQQLQRNSNQVYRGVPVKDILNFFADYSAHEKQEDMSSDPVLAYIRKRLENGDDRYHTWNLALLVPNRQSAALSEAPLGPYGRVRTAIRSSMTDESFDTADIKALMSLPDLMVDFNEESAIRPTGWKAVRDSRDILKMPPLLLLYPIDRQSEPANDNDKRFPLAAAGDVLGMGMWFPSATDSDDASYVSVELPDIEHEDDDYYSEVEQELARAQTEESTPDD